jgi:acyl dehydratase
MPTTPTRIDGLAGFQARLGEEIGVSDWHRVTQEDVSAFGALTGDEYWIHVDPARAAATPFGGTIAHGFFTLSLAPRFMDALVAVDGVAFGVNYGADRLRFPAPMPVGERVRMRARLTAVDPGPAGFRTTMRLTFEREGGDRPVCVLDWLGHYATA